MNSKSDRKKDLPTVEEVLESQKNDNSWKVKPWVGEDGYEYRKNRVKNKDGTYTIFEVRIGKKPLVEPQQEAT